MKTYILFVATLLAGMQIAGCGSSENAASKEHTEAHEHAGGESGHKDGDEHAEGEHEGEHEEEGAEGVTISAESANAAGLELREAGPARVSESLPLYGVIAPDAQRVHNVSARYAGVVRSVKKALGENVRAGEALVTVESNDSLQTYSVPAPISGVITARNVNPGETVSDQALFTVSDLSKVWVELSVFPRDLVRVRLGQTVDVKTLDGGLTGSGKISWISPSGAAATQSLTARVVLDNGDRRWAPGLYVVGEVRVSEADVALAVDSAALQIVDEKSSVFVVDGDTYTPHAVRVGRKDSRVTEILEGLEPGDRYVAKNSFIVKAELAKGEAEHEH